MTDPTDGTSVVAPAGGATIRAIATGMVIGTLLTPCNVYSGLKIGWSFNMSITAGLLAFAFWRFAQDLAQARPWHLQENVINQTTASSAASIVSSGLVAPIPALTLLTGTELSLPLLWLWVVSVSMLGIVIAIPLRSPMLVREKLVFPAGVATAETLREIHARGSEAAARVRMLLSGALVSGGLKLFTEFGPGVARWSPPIAWQSSGALREGGIATLGLKQLGFALDPSLLMVGFGAIIGLRAGLSLLLGAVVAWLGLAPWLLAQGWAAAGPADDVWFAPLVEWLLWPGVTLMTVASLTGFVQALWLRRRVDPQSGEVLPADGNALSVSRQAFVAGAAAAGGLAIFSQYFIFGIPPWLGLVSVLLAFVLAVVASRAVGETGIPPIGAIGKIAQLSFGVAAPANPTLNLMGANVTGGAAGQCADLLDDLRAGQLLGTE
ncbi:MAG TPA: OPT/YSL family transporter, partial [Lautropia sp.]|nr:OPT/YSL family transporter [Lautropia sp.]